MEHLGATNRLGYSRTVTALGAAYEDVDALLVQSRAGRTPTLFTSTALLGEDSSLVEDARIRTLYPRWEYARLQDRARQMAAIDRTPQLASLARNVAQVKRMIRNGGRVLSGRCKWACAQALQQARSARRRRRPSRVVSEAPGSARR